MKSILEFLLKLHVNETPYNEEEVKNDLKDIEWKETAEKKALDAKYHVGSKRWKDIEKHLLIILQGIRANKKSFDEDDIHYFYKLDPPQPYNKWVKFIEPESDDFIKYYKDELEKKLKSEKRKHGSKIYTLYDFANMHLGNNSNYMYCYADKRKIDFYNNCRRYLGEND